MFRRRALIVPFVSVWLVYFLFLLVFFSEYLHGGLRLALILQCLFVGVILLPNAARGDDFRQSLQPVGLVDKVFLIGLTILATAAAASLFYDRILQGIDYSQGVCGARDQMAKIGEIRTGISSIYSFFGLLFGYLYFAALPIAFMRKMSRRLFWIIVFVSFGFLMIQSVLTASRFAALIYVLVLIALAAMRLTMSPIPKLRSSDVICAFVILALASGYIVNEFSCRANLAHLNGEDYAASFTAHLLIPMSSITEADSQSLPPVVRHVLGLLKMTAYYASHSAFTFGAIVDLDFRPGIMSLAGPMFLLSKIGIDFPAETISPTIAGRFVSLPGSFYYDIGAMGMTLLSIGLSAILLVTRNLSRRFPQSFLISSALACLLVVLYVSPVTFAVNIMHFPFIVFAMILGGMTLDILNYFGRKPDFYDNRRPT